MEFAGASNIHSTQIGMDHSIKLNSTGSLSIEENIQENKRSSKWLVMDEIQVCFCLSLS